MLLLDVDCSAPIYSVVLYPIKNIMNLIMIIGPILLIISLVILFTQMVMNPDEKKTPKKIFNALFALCIMVFVSCIVNASMYLLGENTSVTKCWNSAQKTEMSKQYIDIYDQNNKNKVTIDSDKFESGKERNEEGSSEGSLSTNSSDRTINARNAAVNWAINIANDDSFHYGQSSWAHHNGCYFCGTNQKSTSAKRKDGGSLKQVEKTYCCNPFVTAAYAHGAGAKEVDCKVGSKRFGLANDSNKVLQNRAAFEYIQKPSSVNSLKPGDILLTPTHAMLYAGNGNVVHASGADDGVENSKRWKDSIRVSKIGGQWGRVTKIYRYIGTGKF